MNERSLDASASVARVAADGASGGDWGAWEPLLQRLADAPRENGTAALRETANFLLDAFARAGVDAELVTFTAHPMALRLAGVLALGGTLLYARLLRSGRHAAALVTTVALAGALVADLEYYVPVFSWLGAERQHHVVATVPPEGEVERRLLVTAHYDTKTDLLDHTERRPAEWLAAPAVLLMALAALAGMTRPRRRVAASLRRALLATAPWLGVAFGALFFAALSAGAFLPERSPGALDDGGACAVAVRLAGRVAATPLERTELQVALLSAEEVGVQGSWVLAARRFDGPTDVPTAVVNLELLGAPFDLSVMERETFLLRGAYPADPALVALADRVSHELQGGPVHVGGAGATDARSFLAHGVPALTLASDLRGEGSARGLHSAADDRSRLDPAALDAHLDFLEALARGYDRRP